MRIHRRLILFMIDDFFHCLTCRFVQSMLIVLVMSGCSVLKDPADTHKVASEPGYPWVPLKSKDVSLCFNKVDKDDIECWCEGENTLNIASLIDVALQNNPTVEEQWANARSAAFGVGIAESDLYPTITGQEIYDYTDVKLTHLSKQVAAIGALPISPTNPTVPVNPTNPTDTNSNFTTSNTTGAGYRKRLFSALSLSYLLLDFGGRQANIEAARQALYSSDWMYNRQLQQVIVWVLQSYYNYEGYKALVEAKESDLKDSKNNLEAAQQLFEFGINTKLDVLLAQSNLANVELSLIQLKGQLEIALSQLLTNMGLPGDTPIKIQDLPDQIPTDKIDENIKELIEIAKVHRPDLAAALADYNQAKSRVQVARSASLPTITANLYFQKTNILNNPVLNNRVLSGSLSLNVPIFSGFLYENQIRQAKETVRFSRAALRERELGVVLDVLSSYYNFTSASQSVKYTEDYLKYTNESYVGAMELYREGIGTFLDVLVAQRDLAEARAQKVQSRTQLFIALANIAFATGVSESLFIRSTTK